MRRNERKSEKLCEQFFPPLIKDSFLKRSTLAKYPASTFAALISYSSPKFDSFGGGRKGERVSLSTIAEKRGIKETLYRYQRRENNKREEKFLLKIGKFSYFPLKVESIRDHHQDCNPIFVSIFLKKRKEKKERKEGKEKRLYSV